MTHEQFLHQKEELKSLFETAIFDTLTKMGDNIKGISWFSSVAGEYNEQITNTRRVS